jgi:alanine-synthesizing transaminase
LAVLEVARRHRLLVLSDEIYDRLLFEGTHVPTGTLADDVAMVTFSGLAKADLCPGWRVGWMLFNNPELTRALAVAVQRLADARLCGPVPVQHAVRPALFGPQDHLAAVMAKLAARRTLLMQKLAESPRISCVKPQGAFYAMPRLDLPGLGSDEDFVLRLLREKHVLFVHGSGFGQRPGTHHLRIVFLPPESVLGPALDRLGELVRAWR